MAVAQNLVSSSSSSSGQGVQRAWKEGWSSRTHLALPSSWLCPPSFPASSTFNDPIASVQQIRRGGSGKGSRQWGEQEEQCTTLVGSKSSCFIPSLLVELEGRLCGWHCLGLAVLPPPTMACPAPCPHTKLQLLSPAWGELIFHKVCCWVQVCALCMPTYCREHPAAAR